MPRAVHPRSIRHTRWGQHLISAMALSVLAACGGGGGSAPEASTSKDPVVDKTPVTLSGTVATGAAVSGTVTAKDANGLVRTGTIAADGSYSIDVTGLQAPFLLRAVGTVGNKQIVLTAPVTAADFNSTINITPLSDLIVANLGGQAAEAFFSAPDFSKLDKASVDNALKDLQAKLAPVLEAAGLTNVDFLRVPFAANHSGVDGLLDVLEINVDAATKTATIVSKVTGDSVSDNLQTKGTDDTTKITLTEDSKKLLKQTTSDPTKTQRVAEVQALLDRYNALYATQLPTAQALTALCAPNFVDSVGDCAAWAQDQLRDGKVGRRAVLKRIVAFDEAQPNNIDAAKTASGDITDDNLGVLVAGADASDTGNTATLLSKVNGQWKIAGERRLVYINLEGVAFQGLSVDAKGTQTVSYSGAGLYIGIDAGTSLATRAVVTGPGLPTDGVVMTGSAHQNFQFEKGGGSAWTQLGDASPNSSSVYTIKVYNGDSTTQLATYQQYLGTKSVPTPAKAEGKFPTVVTPVNAAWCAAFGGLVEWTKPEGTVNAKVQASCSNATASLNSNPVTLDSTNKATLSIPSNYMPEIATKAISSYAKIEVRDADGVNYSTEVTRQFAVATPPVVIPPVVVPPVVIPPVITPPVPPVPPTTQGSKIDGFGGLMVKSGQEQVNTGESLYSAPDDNWYRQLCEDATGKLLAVNFDSTAAVSQVTDQNLLKGRSFTTVECKAPNRADVSLTFTQDGSANVRKGGTSFTASSADMQTILTSTTPPDEFGFSSAIRVFKAVVNNVENLFLAETDTKSDGTFSLFFWKEVFPLLN
jgi:hypothetical protein